MIPCPGCLQTFELRYTPVGPEHTAPSLASKQFKQQCPDHNGKEWEFWNKVR